MTFRNPFDHCSDFEKAGGTGSLSSLIADMVAAEPVAYPNPAADSPIDPTEPLYILCERLLTVSANTWRYLFWNPAAPDDIKNRWHLIFHNAKREGKSYAILRDNSQALEGFIARLTGGIQMLEGFIGEHGSGPDNGLDSLLTSASDIRDELQAIRESTR